MGTTESKPIEIILSPGTHVLKLIYTPEYEVYEKGFQIRANETLKLTVKLKLSDWGRYQRAIRSYDEGKYEEVVKLLLPIAKSGRYADKPGNFPPTKTLFYLGASYIKLGKYSTGAYWLKLYLRHHSSSLKAKWLIAKAKASLGYPDQAIKDLEEVLRHFPYMYQVYQQFGDVIKDLTRAELKEVRTSLTDYLKHMRGEDELLYKIKLAQLNKRLKDMKRAYEFLSEALAVKLGDPWKP